MHPMSEKQPVVDAAEAKPHYVPKDPEHLLSEFLARKQLAAELDLNERTLDRWEALGTGPPRTLVGRKVLYRRASVQRWLAAQEHGHDRQDDTSGARKRRGMA